MTSNQYNDANATTRQSQLSHVASTRNFTSNPQFYIQSNSHAHMSHTTARDRPGRSSRLRFPTSSTHALPSRYFNIPPLLRTLDKETPSDLEKDLGSGRV
ncbi:hypothetical protein CC86DRAFT_104221 [Ophiobolus disseminans]|uniref:Uncharacterized protein n=1 Tax=Ophiobolus disseminans TaxID=1469910 RepID=A0A6A6ZJZ5_9PLEO|nr:hypothetical protein CC86DRAFT_104221 [Ophiobolus disseminans]